jgi:hypothetical protein
MVDLTWGQWSGADHATAFGLRHNKTRALSSIPGLRINSGTGSRVTSIGAGGNRSASAPSGKALARAPPSPNRTIQVAWQIRVGQNSLCNYEG